jgi:hypothetical protein
MLARTPSLACLECGKPLAAPDFAFHGARRERGPAYWSDRGVLCSAVCATRHAAKRRAEGTDMRDPAPDPTADPLRAPR